MEEIASPSRTSATGCGFTFRLPAGWLGRILGRSTYQASASVNRVRGERPDRNPAEPIDAYTRLYLVAVDARF